VILVDANVLLYAVNQDADRHDDARGWFEAVLNGREPVGFSWLVLLAFMRLSTRVGLFPDPLTVEAATAQVEAWLAQPPSLVVEPTPRHLQVLAGLLKQTGTGGNLVSDAHLAALAVEHAAVVVTYDNDFGRFAGVDWQPPAT
jgi:toxin-antitoxin system PIN domain toxin